MRDYYSASDYAVLTMGDYRFYFGYDHTFCPKHGIDSMGCRGNNCSPEWCFVAYRRSQEIMRIPRSKMLHEDGTEEPVDLLCAGISIFGDKFFK